MNNTSMYQSRQQQAPMIETYDLNQIGSQFQGWHFNQGDPYDRIAPQIALMAIKEIQGRAQQGHPIRVGMFNIISDNAFNNADFQYLVNVIMIRIQYGMTNGEWHNLNVAAGDVITRVVKCCGSAMAAGDDDFMRSMAQGDANAVVENAGVWTYLDSLAQGKVQYMPFNQMAVNNQFNPVNSTTRDALNAAKELSGITAGAFVESSGYDSPVIRGGNNAGQSNGRYARRMEAMTGTMHGSLQTALKEQAPQTAAAAAPYKSRLRATTPTAQQNPQAIEQFDNDVTDFTKSLDLQPAPVKEVAKSIYSWQVGDTMVDIIRDVGPAGAALWVATETQRFHPAWCKRTHTMRYLETSTGIILAIPQELKPSEKEIAMDYDAHAIDPTKGQPAANIPKKPVREEAKVLYSADVKASINIIVSDKMSMEEDVAGCVRNARLSAELSTPVPDAYVKKSIVNIPIVYEDEIGATDDRIVLTAIGASRDFAEASKLMKQIANPLARKTLDKLLTHAVNTAVTCELGVPVRISSFEEDGAEIVGVVENTQGALFGETLRAKQTAILRANVMVASAMEMKAHANATLTMDDQEELPDDKLKTILFLSYNAMAVWVKFTDDELAIGVPEKGAAQIQESTYGALYAVAKAVFEQVTEKDVFTEFHIVTKDNVRYRLHRSLISRNCFLISKETPNVN